MRWPQQEEDPREVDRRARLFLVAVVLTAVFAVLTAVIGPRLCEAGPAPLPNVAFSWSGEPDARAAQIGRFLEEWFRDCSPRKLVQAQRHVPDVVAVAQGADVNPALIAAVVTYESSWEPGARGKIGEVGLMQVGRWTSIREGASPREQLEAGAAVLRRAYARCGTTAGALSFYATGRSCALYRGARLRLRLAAHIESL
jgi:hypothetical protein